MHRILAWPKAVSDALRDAGAVVVRGQEPTRPALAPTPRVVVASEGTARLYRFVPPRGEDDPSRAGRPAATAQRLDRERGTPLLLIPSLINRWYILDLRRGASFAEALVDAGIDTYLLDWGIPEDEDRFLTWEDVLGRLGRAIRKVQRVTGAKRVGLLGYCMGATLSGIWTALHPERVAAFINLAGPFDFAAGGQLTCMVHPQHFDADVIADAGNVDPVQMQSGFVALRPTLELSKWIGYLERRGDPAAREAFEALDAWASDNIPFPGEAYRTYIRELYQQNGLVAKTHRVRGRTVDLGAIRCPILTIVADRDSICPPAAATALGRLSGSRTTEIRSVPGGHVGAVVGSRAARELYPATTEWFISQTRSQTDAAQ